MYSTSLFLVSSFLLDEIGIVLSGIVSSEGNPDKDIDYEQVVPILTEALKKQQHIIEELNRQMILLNEKFESNFGVLNETETFINSFNDFASLFICCCSFIVC